MPPRAAPRARVDWRRAWKRGSLCKALASSSNQMAPACRRATRWSSFLSAAALRRVSPRALWIPASSQGPRSGLVLEVESTRMEEAGPAARDAKDRRMASVGCPPPARTREPWARATGSTPGLSWVPMRRVLNGEGDQGAQCHGFDSAAKVHGESLNGGRMLDAFGIHSPKGKHPDWGPCGGAGERGSRPRGGVAPIGPFPVGGLGGGWWCGWPILAWGSTWLRCPDHGVVPCRSKSHPKKVSSSIPLLSLRMWSAESVLLDRLEDPKAPLPSLVGVRLVGLELARVQLAGWI